MWIPILIGVAVGVIALMYMFTRQTRQYRELFSDTHLGELAAALEGARVGQPFKTFGGITLTWEELPQHSAVMMRSEKELAPAASNFLLAFVSETRGNPSETKFLKLSSGLHAIVWPKQADGDSLESPRLDILTLDAIRHRAANAMKDLVVVEGSLDAFR